MPLPPSQPPQDLPEELRWRTVKVKPGIKHAMVLAGEPFGCETHHPRTRTLPCYASLKGCTLRCPWCTYQRRFTCWVPLIDPAGGKQAKIVVMGGKRTWNSVANFKPGEIVTIARGEAERDTVIFHTAHESGAVVLHQKKWESRLPLDVRPYIFHLWQLRDLSHNFGLEFHSSIRTDEIEAKLRDLTEDPKREPHL